MRRSRYTVWVRNRADHRIPLVILAYSGEDAADFHRRSGYEVVGVEKGDYRKAERTVRLSTGAKVNAARMREAVEFLGLRCPIEIHYNARTGPTYGNHRAVPVGSCYKHRIMLKSYLSAEQMGETLWHELAHAMQFERDVLPRGLNPKDAMRLWHMSYRDGTAYRDKPYEVEARSYENFNAEIPLARS